MIKTIFSLLTVLLLVLPSQLIAGDDEDVSELPVRERIMIGGYLGLQFGTITAVNISPTIAYRITNRMTSGVGGTYQYYRDSRFTSSSELNISSHIYGGSAFSRYHIIPQIFAHVEYEALNLDSRYGVGVPTDLAPGRFWEHNYFAGGGYRAPLGNRAFLNIMLLYNFNSESVVHYQNPVFRFGIDVRM